jgi:hypothetical protein
VARVVAGADGSRFPIGWFDTQLGAPCATRVEPTLDTSDVGAVDERPNLPGRCVPPYVRSFGIDCATKGPRLGAAADAKAADRATCSDVATDFAIDEGQAAAPRLFRKGAPVPDASVVASCNQGGCVCQPSPTAVGLAEEVTEQLARLDANSPHRLAPTGEAGIWRDSARGELCRFTRVKDGSIRCAPLGPRATPVFEGTSCAEPPFGLVAEAPTDVQPKTLRIDGSLCDRVRAFSVTSSGAPYPTVWRRGQGQECWPPPSETVGTGAPHDAEIGPLARVHEIEPGDLVEGTLVTE